MHRPQFRFKFPTIYKKIANFYTCPRYIFDISGPQTPNYLLSGGDLKLCLNRLNWLGSPIQIYDLHGANLYINSAVGAADMSSRVLRKQRYNLFHVVQTAVSQRLIEIVQPPQGTSSSDTMLVQRKFLFIKVLLDFAQMLALLLLCNILSPSVKQLFNIAALTVQTVKFCLSLR